MLPSPTLQEIIHPTGESISSLTAGHNDTFVVDAPGGIFHVSHDAESEVSHLGGMVPFAQFLHASGSFAGWVGDAPLSYAGNRALGAVDILGTQVLSMLSGHYRFAHIAALRGDTVTPPLLGLKRVASEDTVRRAMERLVKTDADQVNAMRWLRRRCVQTLGPLLGVPWLLDMNTKYW